MFNNLQALRAYAALSVLVFHFTLVPAMMLPINSGSFGVDVFFVLSGFIIAWSADKSTHHFLLHRLIRVLPTYWIVTTLGFGMTLLAMSLPDALGWYGQSLLFLTRADGRPPIIFVGWTLLYELFFYVIYAGALRLGARLAPWLCVVLFGALAYGLDRMGAPMRPWPLLAEFAYGLAIFLFVKAIGPSGGGAASRWLALLLVAGGLFALYWFEPEIKGAIDLAHQMRRAIVLGLPSAAIVLGLILLERAGWRTNSRIVLALGNTSYALYLLHPLFFAVFLQMKPGDTVHRVELFAGLAAVTALIAWLFYRVIEAPLIRLLRRWLARDPPPVVQDRLANAAAGE